jgi:HEAT repeat protein
MEYGIETRENRASMSRRSRERRKFLDLLRSQDIDGAVAELGRLPGRGFVNPLRSALCSDERARWSAVTAMGLLTAELADRDLESARVVMRTLMWNLTEESGGIAWGVPESVAEVMACHETLASEYAPILVSYAREDGNFLEYEPLQRGVTWGLGRLAQVRPELLLTNDAGRYLLPYLESADATVRGLAAWASGLLGNREAGGKLEALLEDREPVSIYLDRELVSSSVGELARQALARMPSPDA